MNSFDPFISSEYYKNLKDENPLESDPQLHKKTDSEFLSQILSYPFGCPTKISLEHPQTYTIGQRQSETSRTEEHHVKIEASGKTKKKCSKNSLFHNFQKHLVITLRQVLTLKSINSKGGVECELAAKIFEKFKKSQKTSRQFLEQVFGLFEPKDPDSCNSFIKTIRQGVLKNILEGYDDETLIGAQNIIKHLTKKQLDNCDFKTILYSRKIEKKKQFIEYINLFNLQLVQGKQRKKTYKLLAQKFIHHE